MHSEAVIDTDAIRRNVGTVRSATSAQVMAVVKADGYGHGMLVSARAALAGGASWLGVAFLHEALELRAAGITAPVLAWLWTPEEADLVTRAVAGDIDVSVSTVQALEIVVAAAQETGRTARVHLKIDTGLSRNGATEEDWPELVGSAVKAVGAGSVEATGIWSHFVRSDEPEHPTNAAQIARFRSAVDVAAGLGFVPQVRHLANSAAALMLPESHFDLVRAGIAVYGLSPSPSHGDFGLRPAMTLRGRLAIVKDVPAGTGVSYGHVYTTDADTTVGLVPLGYGDGIPRAATNRAPVSVGGRRYTVSGRVCMDQFVIDLHGARPDIGDDVVLFGPGDAGEPTAQDWAQALDTINYEIVTRIGARVPRVYVGQDAAL